MITPTSSQPASTPLSDADVTELNDLLLAIPEEREPLDVVMLDGFLTAVLLQPEPVARAAWLPLVFDAQGREPAPPGETAAAERTIGLVLRRHDEIAAHLAAREAFDPILFDLEDDAGKPLEGKAAIAAFEPWAAGFMNALHAFPALLAAAEASDEGIDALNGILRHLPLDPDAGSVEARRFMRDKAQMDADAPLADLDDAIDDVVGCVLDLADVTRPRRPIEREAPKVGRNDPCPCGSGRKFKQCHGRDGP
jgi:uncharacterized protein